MAKKIIESQFLDEKVLRNRLSFWSWTRRRRKPPIPNRRVRRVKGWISLKATFVAMKENPQKIIAHNAGQDKIYILSLWEIRSLLNTKREKMKPFHFLLDRQVRLDPAL
jgi:hypothetical protein